MGKKLVTGAVGPSRARRWSSVVGLSMLAILFALGAILIGISSWIRRTFGPISVDQMLLNLPGAGGAETTGAESVYISSFVWQALVAPLAAAAVIFAVAFFSMRRTRRNYAVAPKKSAVRRSLETIAKSIRLRRWAPTLLTLVTVIVGGSLFAQSIGASQYVRSATTSMSMSDYYVAPAASPSGQPRNLITIYLESIEDAFGDDSVFEENMIEPLQTATKDWSRIDQLHQFDGGGWTMAGIVGTQCGIPLRGTHAAAAGELEYIGSDREEFMPGATCLGDVLSGAGYTNVFMGGADAQFASKENFLRSHGYDEVLDLRTWQALGETEISSWGLSDRALFEHAKGEVSRLSEAGQPFNLTILTLDTHDPAHAFDYCPISTEVAMTSITFCSMEQVAGFIDYLDAQSILDNTAVVLMGDHEKFVSDGSNYQELLQVENRTIFNRIWSPDGLEPARENVDQLSLLATMLELVGMKLERHSAGVGISVFSPGNGTGGVLALSREEYAEVIQSRSAELYHAVWKLTPEEQVDAGYFDPKNP